MRREREGLPQLKNKGIPKNCHKKELQEALKRGASEQSAQHVAARKVQIDSAGSSRLGSDGLATFAAEVVSI